MNERTCSIDGCTGAAQARGWCMSHYNRWHYSGSTTKLPQATTCRHCGETLPPKVSLKGPRSPYCSRVCRNAIAVERSKAAGTYAVYVPRSKPLTERPCVECNVPFMAKRVDTKICSPICGNRRRDRLNPLRCTEDGCDRGVRGKGLCSMHWRRAARADGREVNPAWDERRQANWSRRSALKRGAGADEKIVHSEVFARDGWLCGICDLHVDDALTWPDPMSASLDHILPLSKGGPHLLANVQLAHLACNISKGDRVAA